MRIKKEDILKLIKSPKLPIQEFFESESTSGILLIIAAVIALIVANSSLSSYYFDLLHANINIQLPFITFDKTFHHWVNDGLMTVFFLLVGMEIKRELVHGELSSFKSALLPIVAAFGGAILPAIIYLSLNKGTPYESGWGIPMATDIAFAVGVLTLLGPRVPLWAKIFLTAVAVVDDIIAVLVIAVFYTAELNTTALLVSAFAILVLIFMNWKKVNSIPIYILIGIILWAAVLKSGIHATIAGVLLGFIIPVRTVIKKDELLDDAWKGVRYLEESFSSSETETGIKKASALNYLSDVIINSESPLHRLEHKLNNWVAYFIMPVFAFTNSGLVLSTEVISTAGSSTITWGIILGLFFGKQIGIFLSTFILIFLGVTNLKVDKKTIVMLYGISVISGIGFTMSLFISNMAFTENADLENAKIGIIIVSLVCGMLGYLLIRLFTRKQKE
ncbi:MAG: Na+/H+ antiporter NhaA [Melioribacteraceae bacterium]